jgi:hypothetical protein
VKGTNHSTIFSFLDESEQIGSKFLKIQTTIAGASGGKIGSKFLKIQMTIVGESGNEIMSPLD